MFNNIDARSFDVALACKDEVIVVLEQKVHWLERELELQRKRADLAIDRLLASQKIPTVMPENIVFPTLKQAEEFSEKQKAIEALRSEIESIGEISEDKDRRPTDIEEVQ